MKQVVLEGGVARVMDVPAPAAGRGAVLVRVDTSIISTGTERANLASSAESAFAKARRRPELALQLARSAGRDGLALTIERIRHKLADPIATGYSCAGVVVACGPDASDFRVGDRVACAGSQWAWHAEYVAVPRNLLAPVPDGVPLSDAASVALGCIGLQGVRQGALELGHVVVVSGLGVIGLQSVQLARAAGARIIAIDPQPERRRVALTLGAAVACGPDDADARVAAETGGLGVDRVLLCAATPSADPLKQAMQLTRRRGIVVIVGDVGLQLERSPFYEKEIELRIACSYGPGRYDPAYEEDGLDYPAAWVRWTEGRNMSAYLELLERGAVQWSPLVEATYPAEQAPEAYARLNTTPAPIALALQFTPEQQPVVMPPRHLVARRVARAEGVRLGIIGAGSFVRAVHLPMLRRLRGLFQVTAVANRSGVRAAAAARQAGAPLVTTDYRQLLESPEVDAVIIATRHQAHASLAMEALRAGKHVFVEKPPALDEVALNELLAVVEGSSNAFTVGYNRRFSRALSLLQDAISKSGVPPVVQYRVNADPGGLLDWTHGASEGGRAIGEACHMVDFLVATARSPITHVAVSAASKSAHPDANFVATLQFGSGMIATLLYSTQGAKALSKERVEALCGSEAVVIDDFRFAQRLRGSWAPRPRLAVTKGHEEIWRAFHTACTTGDRWPIPLADIRTVSETTFRIRAEALR